MGWKSLAASTAPARRVTQLHPNNVFIPEPPPPQSHHQQCSPFKNYPPTKGKCIPNILHHALPDWILPPTKAEDREEEDEEMEIVVNVIEGQSSFEEVMAWEHEAVMG